jgi:hypothetical protein
MPVLSRRKALLKDLNGLLKQLIIDGKESVHEFTEIMELAASISSHRYLNVSVPIPKNQEWRELFFAFPDNDFRQMARMDQISFLRLLQKIEDHPVFHNESLHHQELVWVQLAVALNRFGCFGNGVSIGRVARFSGISNGSVWNFTKRVIQAILSLTPDYIHWPDANKRRKIAARFYEKHRLRNCVGIVDGTPVIFIQKPAVDGETFFDRYTSSCLLYAMRKCFLCCVVYVFEYIHWKALYKWGRLSPFFFFTGKAATRSICN